MKGWWVIISLFWLRAAGFMGAVIGLNKLDDELYSYVEGVRRGEALFVVETPAERVSEVVRILWQEHSTVVHQIHEEIEAR